MTADALHHFIVKKLTLGYNIGFSMGTEVKTLIGIPLARTKRGQLRTCIRIFFKKKLDTFFLYRASTWHAKRHCSSRSNPPLVHLPILSIELFLIIIFTHTGVYPTCCRTETAAARLTAYIIIYMPHASTP
ncbi:hypothetical protein ACJX0J_037785 [Zea mays]